MTDGSISRIAMIRVLRTRIAAPAVAGCIALLMRYVLYRWMMDIPIVDLRL
jgi:hypothetical protein